MNEQIYPLGEQSFSELRNYNQVYVDKTHFIPKLLKNKFYFLSRPRRFGKSLFLSTLEHFFLGNKDLFKGLAIEKFDWEWDRHPVLKISFASGSFIAEGGLTERINTILERIGTDYEIEIKGKTASAIFENIIYGIYRKTGKKLVILIDEYEKPLLDSYGLEIFEKNRNELAEFYSVFKDNTEYIRLLFITGITRFGKINIFSGLNNLIDISLETQYESICGITEEEIKKYFIPGVEYLAQRENSDIEKALFRLKQYYDGYHFSEDTTDIYNPWSLMNCLAAGRFKSEWFSSGSSTYLLKIIRKKNYDLSNLIGSKATEEQLKGVSSDMMDPTPLLYQSGYLTIKNYDRQTELYEIGLPNFEVRTALFEYLIPFYLGKDEKIDRRDILKLFNYMESGKAEEMMKWLASYFSKISFYSKLHFERDFHVIVIGIFLLVKDFNEVHCEYAMSSGRTDLVVEAGKFVYVFEFKIGENAQKALEQIDFRGYDIPWNSDGRKVFKIGAAFSTKNNGILRYDIKS